MIFADRQGVGEKLAAALRSRRQSCTLVYAGEASRKLGDGVWELAPDQVDSYSSVVGPFAGSRADGLRGVVHLWSLDSPEMDDTSASELADVHRLGCRSVLPLVQALAGAGADRTPKLWLVTRDSQAVIPQDSCRGGHQAPLWGMARVVRLEHPELQSVCVDLDRSSADEAVAALFAEIWHSSQEDQVAFRDGCAVCRSAHAPETNKPGRWREPVGVPRGRSLPVNDFNARDAREFARWIRARAARQDRAKWNCACGPRGSSSTTFWMRWGSCRSIEVQGSVRSVPGRWWESDRTSRTCGSVTP